MPGVAPSFDAVLLIAFGGPQGPGDIRPFLQNVVRGRRVPPERLERVAKQYELFGGVSPITAITQRQATGLQDRLRAGGLDLPVRVGMRNWTPYLADTLAELARGGAQRVLAIVAAAHHSYSSCQQYKENVRDARRALGEAGLPDVAVQYVPSWYDHPRFIAAHADHVRAALARLPAEQARHARLIFTAHSLPQGMADGCAYVAQLRTTAERIARAVGCNDWSLAYQSRSGRPSDPWLEPDISDYLRSGRAGGLQAVVVSPIGFIADHIEVLYDLDTLAAGCAGELGITWSRAATVNDHPLFLDMLAELVRAECARFERHAPLPIVGPMDRDSHAPA